MEHYLSCCLCRAF